MSVRTTTTSAADAPWPLATAASEADRLRAGVPTPAARRLSERLGSAPVTVALDPSRTAAEARAVAATLSSRVDAIVVLVVEQPLPATSAVLRALAHVEARMTVLCAVAVHDRNRVAVEGDLAALADIGVAGVVLDPGREGSVVDLTPIEAVGLARWAGHLVALLGVPGDDLRAWRDAGVRLVVDVGRDDPGDLDRARAAGMVVVTGDR